MRTDRAKRQLRAKSDDPADPPTATALPQMRWADAHHRDLPARPNPKVPSSAMGGRRMIQQENPTLACAGTGPVSAAISRNLMPAHGVYDRVNEMPVG